MRGRKVDLETTSHQTGNTLPLFHIFGRDRFRCRNIREGGSRGLGGFKLPVKCYPPGTASQSTRRGLDGQGNVTSQKLNWHNEGLVN